MDKWELIQLVCLAMQNDNNKITFLEKSLKSGPCLLAIAFNFMSDFL